MFKKVKLVLATIRYLKPVQLKYQLLYRLKKIKPLKAYQMEVDFSKVNILSFDQTVNLSNCYLGNNRFKFLNIEHDFGDKINWNEQRFGKLWNYNLQYGNYLLQNNISLQKKIDLLTGLYEELSNGNLSLEPYPVSLRTINIIRLVCSGVSLGNELLSCLHTELSFLSKRLEFHILGNHLLENAFALAMGGAFFGEDIWVKDGVDLILHEIDEQILLDGGHFELSPMYHQIILFRLLEFCDWYSKYRNRDEKTLDFVREKTSQMLNWLEQISFENGDIPLFNDSAKEIAYSSKWLFDYGERLNVPRFQEMLGESGYRAVNLGKYECRIDFAQVGASYQPGHSHADALSFILYYDKKPLFVEQGTSTYQIGERRNLERSTQAHNTVEICNTNQSQVWGGFRTAARAYVNILKEEGFVYQAVHSGYKRRFNVLHTRTFSCRQTNIEIYDKLSKSSNAKCYFHLHPDVTIELVNSFEYLLNNSIKITFKGAKEIIVEDYEFADSYNKYKSAKRLIVIFDHELYSKLLLKD
ncbi:alginate lyase family protein [Sphingobacterium sp.]|uniref:alginate lyase family protein n=1 Tax=Sphingobacterium sp. TaxID=341027 RepID=UPI00289EA408|nr:alginate lyase family protein [Sphingobacterium sp.]